MSYEPTIWRTGDTVTAEKLNKIEQAIVADNTAIEGKVGRDEFDTEIATLESKVGSPLIASTVSEMTETDRVYVYTGSETGYTSGNWYYYDGTAWTSGGVYNAVAIETDTTLSVSGKAADAKKVGDELADVKEDLTSATEDIEQLFTGVEILDATVIAGSTNTDVTNNNDGTYTIGTTDYGNTAFGSAITLKAGCTYYLYGVPQGIAYLFPSTSSTSASYNNRIFENTGSTPKRFYTDTDVTVYVGYRIAAKPDATITISPSLIRSIPVERYFKHNIAFFGDSVMWGQDGAESTRTQTPWPIPDTVSNILGVGVKNYGVSGQGYMPTTASPTPAYGTISNVDLSDFDTVVLSYGVNDGFSELGSWDSDDENTIMGQFHKIVNYIYTQSPTMRIIVFAPINGKNIGTFPDYWYGPRNHQLGYVSRRILSDTLKQACDYYWIPYIEMYDGPIKPNNISLFLPDGVHPSNDCYKQLGEWYAAKIRGVM